MERRLLLKSVLTGSAILTVAGATTWIAMDTEEGPLTIEYTLKRIAEMKQNLLNLQTNDSRILTTGNWELSQILNHCAQSVEYSISEYPEHKSELFKNTLGSFAFSAFAAKGKMSHNLSEAIPGAPLLTPKDIDVALNRLQLSLTDFQQHAGKLQPHFAYGELTKSEYELAHVMHFNNHLKEIMVV
ncbi:MULTISPECIES: DUF1569 domain-containing protein [unclassified Shewanella]|uniref:DUF1569 domain-containing protein n=1 Tax=unclassified Shewanella TaxID=196818 RepID=UPI00354CE516